MVCDDWTPGDEMATDAKAPSNETAADSGHLNGEMATGGKPPSNEITADNDPPNDKITTDDVLSSEKNNESIVGMQPV